MGAARLEVDAGIDAQLGADLAACSLALARRFVHGATMWCIAPQWPQHARHIAVEFVHPVVVGTRALPAVSIDIADPTDALRTAARAGDIVLGVSPSVDAAVLDVMLRAPAWGIESIWLGAGPRPHAGAADHVLWLPDAQAADAAHDGRLVVLYHVLWELTHVCLEHPGLLAERCPGDEAGSACVTCSDEGTLGEVVAEVGAAGALVRTARGLVTVDTTLVGPVVPWDLIVVHAGSAIALLEGAGA